MIRKKWIPYFFAALFIIITCSLGYWQMQRAAEKEFLQKNTNSNNQIIGWQDFLLLEKKINYLGKSSIRVLIHGVWLPSMTQYLDNRSNSKGQAGISVITPLCTAIIYTNITSDNQIIEKCTAPLLLVKRGWLPRNIRKRDVIKPFKTPTIAVEFEGLIHRDKTFDRVYSFKIEDSPKKVKLRQNLNIDDFAAAFDVDVYPFFAEQKTEVTQDGLIAFWSKDKNLDRKITTHYGYAFQWFSLATTIAVLAIYLFLKDKKLPIKKA